MECTIIVCSLKLKNYFEISSINYVIMCMQLSQLDYKYKTSSVGIWMDLECNNAVYSYTGNMKNAKSRP